MYPQNKAETNQMRCLSSKIKKLHDREIDLLHIFPSDVSFDNKQNDLHLRK